MSDEGVYKYCTVDASNPYHLRCNFCGHVTRGSDEITWMKFHLSGNDPEKNVKKCPSVPPQVKVEMRSLVAETEQRKKDEQTLDDMIDDEESQLVGSSASARQNNIPRMINFINCTFEDCTFYDRRRRV